MFLEFGTCTQAMLAMTFYQYKLGVNKNTFAIIHNKALLLKQRKV